MALSLRTPDYIWQDMSVQDRFARPLSDYALPEPTAMRAQVGPDRRTLIETKLETFGEHPSGLGKFTRSMFARDLRRQLSVTPAEVPQ